MTREEAIDKSYEITFPNGWIKPEDIEPLINEIYDDFESRTCKN